MQSEEMQNKEVAAIQARISESAAATAELVREATASNSKYRGDLSEVRPVADEASDSVDAGISELGRGRKKADDRMLELAIQEAQERAL